MRPEELITMTTENLIVLHQELSKEPNIDWGPANQKLADIETILIERGEIDRLVRGG